MTRLFSVLIAGLFATPSLAADWPDTAVECRPVAASCPLGECSPGHSVSIAVTENGRVNHILPPKVSAKELCDAVAAVAKKANVSTTRLSDDRILIHGRVYSVSLPASLPNWAVHTPPRTCTKADRFPYRDLSGKEFKPPRTRALLDRAEARWVTEDNWKEVELLGKISQSTVTIVVKWRDCYFNYREFSLKEYFELLRTGD
jgi:hypothetical protein